MQPKKHQKEIWGQNYFSASKKKAMAKKKKNRQDGFVFSTNPDYNPEDNPFGHLLSGSYEKDSGDTNSNNQVLRIHLVRRKGNKEVTLIKGFEGSKEDLKALGKMLKTKCGVGGTVKDGEILIQGNHREKVRKLLIDEGYRDTKLAGG